MNECTMETVTEQDLNNVEGGVLPVLALALAVFALELHIWDMMVSE